MKTHTWLGYRFWIAWITLILVLVSFSAASSQFSEIVFLPWVPWQYPPPTPTLRPTRLLITEFMVDPSGVEPDHEWVEVYNPGTVALDLSGYKLGDEETPGGAEGMYRFPDGLLLGPEQALVIANKAAAFNSSFGVNPDFELRESDAQVPNLEKYLPWGTRDMELVNTGDEVLLLNAADQIIDKVSWGSSTFGFNPALTRPPEGATWARRLAYEDTDTAVDWVLQSLPDPWNADLSTPTPLPTATPRPTWTPTLTLTPTLTPTPTGVFKLLISEVLPSPPGSASQKVNGLNCITPGNGRFAWQVCAWGMRRPRVVARGCISSRTENVLPLGKPVRSPFGQTYLKMYTDSIHNMRSTTPAFWCRI